jgi:hypothetical protein
MRKAGICGLVLLFFAFAALTAACGASATATATDDSNQQRAIQNKGSDTLVNLALAWAEAYREVAPDVSIAVTGGGSGTGIAALINGTVDIANASRAMKENEIEDARANGIDPTGVHRRHRRAGESSSNQAITRSTGSPSTNSPTSTRGASPTGRRWAATTRRSSWSHARRTPAPTSISSKR